VLRLTHFAMAFSFAADCGVMTAREVPRKRKCPEPWERRPGKKTGFGGGESGSRYRQLHYVV